MAADGMRFGGGLIEDDVEDEDLYAVLGLNRDCSDGELRAAYKKLALRWHPDRCSAKESKSKFQAIQEAYSVLSDSNKRFLYDSGIYYEDDQIDYGGGQYGMSDFLGEMAAMMQKNKPSGNAEPSFEELQELFLEMLNGGDEGADEPTPFGDDGTDPFFGATADDASNETDFFMGFSSPSSASSSPFYESYPYSADPFAGSEMDADAACDPLAADVAAGFSDLFDSVAHTFFGGPTASDSGSSTTGRAGFAPAPGDGCGGPRGGRNQKVSFAQDVSSGVADGVAAASY